MSLRKEPKTVPTHDQDDDTKLSEIETANPEKKDTLAILQEQLGDDSKPWAELTKKEKYERVAWGVAKALSLLLLLYIFVCSLDLLSRSFQLLSGKATSNIFENELMSNPVVGVMIGIIATVLVQSSSTSTSIVVSMVAARIIPIRTAIPIVMGANVGTSVTNTIVAITRIGDRAEFGRAFAGATVHDMFNWLSVIVLLTIEVTTDYLYHLTEAIMNGFTFESTGGGEIKILKVITEPLTKAILLIDKNVLNGWATNDPAYDNATLLKIYCDNGEKCASLFSQFALSDLVTGAIMTVLSLVFLCGCLIVLVKLLQNVLQGSMAHIIQRTVNADVPYVPWLTGYIAMFVGAVATFLMQSSSVFTSALTPLVGMGIITVSRTYPLTLGSNIGTTTTAILAALTAPSDKLRDTLQVAFCHLFFNITGILIFYPIPFMRWPLPLARGLGRTTAQYRWFAIAYLLVSFVIVPLLILGLTLADPNGYALLGVGIPVVIIIVFVVIVNVLQAKFPSILPPVVRNWEWLPLGLRSLQTVDSFVVRSCACCKCCRKLNELAADEDEEKGQDNHAYSNLKLE